MLYVKNKKVHHNIELKLYQVIDEKDQPHQVVLLPKPKCSCEVHKHTKNELCAHILAVKNLNGEDIAAHYKVPKLSNLIRVKNAGRLTGRKRRGKKWILKFLSNYMYIILVILGHAANSAPPPSISQPIESLVTDDNHKCVLCSQSAASEAISCSTCSKLYHWKCANVSAYHRSGRSKKWICSKYGYSCLE